MVPLWFTLSALCFVGAAVLLYVDIDRRRGRGRRRKSWARSHGFDYEQESTEILKRWKRGVMSTVGSNIPARNVVLGQIRGEAVFIFDLEEVATVIALHRKVGTNVVVDIGSKGSKNLARTTFGCSARSGREWCTPPTWTPPAAPATAAWSPSPTPRPTAPRSCGTSRTGRWSACRSAAPAPSGTKVCAPSANSTTCCGYCRRCRSRQGRRAAAGDQPPQGSAQPSAGPGRSQRGAAAPARGRYPGERGDHACGRTAAARASRAQPAPADRP